MSRPSDIGCVFNAHIVHQDTSIYQPVGFVVLPASREVSIEALDALNAVDEMRRIQTSLENNPKPMRLVSLPLFFEQSAEFSVDEYLRVVCRILELTTPNSLNLTCDWSLPEKILEATLDSVRRVLCPVLLSLDSLVHIGVEETSWAPVLPSAFTEFVDEVFSSTPGCHSLRLFWHSHRVDFSTGARIQAVLLKRYMAHTNDVHFHEITRIQCPWVPDFQSCEVQFFRLLRVSDLMVPAKHDFPLSPWDACEYVSVLLLTKSTAQLLAEALSMPSSRIRGLRVSASRREVHEFANAIGSSPVLEEISVKMPPFHPKTLVVFADFVSRSQQLQHVSIECADGCDVEGALAKMLACSSLRVLRVEVKNFISPSQEVIALIRSHRSLEYCFVGKSIPSRERYEFTCQDNFVQSVRVLMLLLLQWVGSFTELSAVDINLFRIIRTWVIMPIDW